MVRIDLAGTWRLERLSDHSVRPMAAPGDIMSALVASGEIPDPYYDREELGLQWIGREDWRLYRSFDATERLLKRRRVRLEIDSVDTIAEISLNGRIVGASDNMFLRFSADVTELLRPGENELSVTLRSPERAAADRAGRLRYPVPASVYPVSSPHRNLVRKAQCMGGWDWGPCLMTGGLYDGIRLVGADGPMIDYVRYAATPEAGSGRDGAWTVELAIDIDSPEAAEASLSLSLAGASLEKTVAVDAGRSVLRERLRVESPERWWPAGYGDQRLYELAAEIGPAGSTGPAATTDPDASYNASIRVGFRELHVDTTEDAHGKPMTFVVNGRPVFAKGANWIPADALPSRWTRARYESLLRSAAEANMNCVRVWGGGRYESDAFYELCDELGLLVWQDCMFSCALYPSSKEFLSSVEAETRHQVRRLASHPSLALWCGNNEALGAITWYDESRNSPARYIVDYDRLTEGTVGRVIRELDPGRTWWPSSPSAGPDDFADNWHSDSRGDMHYWSVWHEGRPFSDYLSVRPRFCSEFGFQSFPSYRMVASFAPDGERNVSSPAMEHHQRHPRGNALIVETMLRYFRMPRGLRETLYLSQVQQAMAIKTAVEYWRCNRPRCMGALYWQLNDVWPGASWSSLEYDGSWKLLHHEAKRFFDSLIAAAFVRDGSVQVYAVNDGAEALEAEARLTLRRFDGSAAAELATFDSVLGAEAATPLWSAPVAGLPTSPGEAFLDVELSARRAGRVETRRTALFLTEPKACAVRDAGIRTNVDADAEGLFVVISAEAPAFYVTLEADGLPGRFSDAGFHLAAGETRRLRFLPGAEATGDEAPGAVAPDQPVTADRLSASLRVMDLRSSYE